MILEKELLVPINVRSVISPLPNNINLWSDYSQTRKHLTQLPVFPRWISKKIYPRI